MKLRWLILWCLIGAALAQVSNNVTVTGAVTPGDCTQFASQTQIQDSGAACGGSSGAVSSVSNSDSTLTISPTTGAVVGSLNLGHANTWTATQTFGTIAPTTISGSSNFSQTTGTSPFTVSSTTVVTNLTAGSLAAAGRTWAAPGTIGGTTPGTGDFSALNCGVSVTTGCILSGFGGTSGSATLTWPAVASTTGNPIVSSNAFEFPNGTVTAPSLVFPGNTGYGFYMNTTNNLWTFTGAANEFVFSTGGILMKPTNGTYAWASGDPTGTGVDTALGRSSAGVVEVGTSSTSNASGSMLLTNLTASGTVSSGGNLVCAPGAFAAQTDAATVTWAIGSVPCANASLLFTVHSGSRTLNLTGLVTGGTYVLKITQDGTGGEGLTLGTGCTWKVSGGGGGAITPSTGAGAIDVLAFTYDGTNCLLNFTKNFS